MQAAATASDHGRLRPCRLIPGTGDERDGLGDVLSEAATPDQSHRAAAKPLCAPLHSRGWGSILRTGAAVEAPQVRKYLGLGDGERLLGWLYVGTRPKTGPVRERPPFDAPSRSVARTRPSCERPTGAACSTSPCTSVLGPTDELLDPPGQ